TKKAGSGTICSTTQAIRAAGTATGKPMVVKGVRKLAETRRIPSPKIMTCDTRKKGGEVPPNASTAAHIATMRPASLIRSSKLLTENPPLTSAAASYPESPPPGNSPKIHCRQDPRGSRNSHSCVDLLCSTPRRQRSRPRCGCQITPASPVREGSSRSSRPTARRLRVSQECGYPRVPTWAPNRELQTRIVPVRNRSILPCFAKRDVPSGWDVWARKTVEQAPQVRTD